MTIDLTSRTTSTSIGNLTNLLKSFRSLETLETQELSRETHRSFDFGGWRRKSQPSSCLAFIIEDGVNPEVAAAQQVSLRQ